MWTQRCLLDVWSRQWVDYVFLMVTSFLIRCLTELELVLIMKSPSPHLQIRLHHRRVHLSRPALQPSTLLLETERHDENRDWTRCATVAQIVIWSLVCNKNTTLFAGCPTGVTISSSTGSYDQGAVLTCVANGYLPSYKWTGAAGVNRDFVLETGPTYTLPGGPFDLICTATVDELSCCDSAMVTDRANSKYQTQQK